MTGPQGETGPVGPQGVKGDPFTYSDFTEAQIKELQKPATDAATKAQEILKMQRLLSMVLKLSMLSWRITFVCHR